MSDLRFASQPLGDCVQFEASDIDRGTSDPDRSYACGVVVAAGGGCGHRGVAPRSMPNVALSYSAELPA